MSLKRVDSTLPGVIPALDRLRGVAIGMVVIAHLAGHLSQGPLAFEPLTKLWLGVDLFLMISGFVVTRSWLALERRRLWSEVLPIYLLRRVGRIVPTAIVWLLLYGLLAYSGFSRMLFGDPAIFWREAGWILTGIYNFRVPATGQVLLEFYWTLALEMHFYLLLPILMFFAKGRVARIAAILMLMLLSAILLRAFVAEPWEWLRETKFWNASLFRLDSIAIGSIVALMEGTEIFERYFLGPFRRLSRETRFATTGVSLTAIATVPHLQDLGWLSTGLLRPILANLSAFLLVGLALTASSVLPGCLNRLWIRVGLLSYSIYLSHIWTFRVVDWAIQRSGRPQEFALFFDSAFLGLAIVGTWVVAEMSFRWVEEPFRRWVRARSERL